MGEKKKHWSPFLYEKLGCTEMKSKAFKIRSKKISSKKSEFWDTQIENEGHKKIKKLM